MTYYNTNNEVGSILQESRKKTETQEKRIETILSDVNAVLTPDHIQWLYFQEYKVDIPITSVRRALTDLTAKGIAIKTDIMLKGRYNKKTHTWRINNEN